MNPRSTFIVSVTAFVATFVYTGIWALHAYAASQPIGNGTVLGASTDTSITTASTTPALADYPIARTGSAPYIPAKEYVLYNPDSGKTLYASQMMDPVPIASTTKLMTAYLTVKYGNPDDIVTVPQEAADAVPSRMGLAEGQQISVRSLLYGALMVSGNDAAISLGSYVGGILLKNQDAPAADRITRAVQEMNTTAAAFHMNNTEYKDPAGLSDEGHSTALDIAKLFAIDLKKPLLAQIFQTANTTVTDANNIAFQLRNSDHLTSDFNYPGNLGGKTGLTDGAGHCLVSAAEQNGVTLIGVVLNTNGQGILDSANAVKTLLDAGFSNFTWK